MFYEGWANVVGFVDRVAAEAVEVRLLRVVLTLLSLPFYALGVLVAVLVVVFRFVWAAARVGFADVLARVAGPVADDEVS